MTNTLLPIERHAVLVLVVLLEDAVVATEVAAADEADEADVVVAAVEEMDLDIVEENYLPQM